MLNRDSDGLIAKVWPYSLSTAFRIKTSMVCLYIRGMKEEGDRRFGVLTWERFMEKYVELDAGHRRFYEIIQEGRPSKRKTVFLPIVRKG